MYHLSGPSPDLYQVLFLVDRTTAWAVNEEPDLVPELRVPDSVDKWTEQTWKNVGEHKGNEEDVGPASGPHCDQCKGDYGRQIGQHADEELDSVKQDGVASIFG